MISCGRSKWCKAARRISTTGKWIEPSPNLRLLLTLLLVYPYTMLFQRETITLKPQYRELDPENLLGSGCGVSLPLRLTSASCVPSTTSTSSFAFRPPGNCEYLISLIKFLLFDGHNLAQYTHLIAFSQPCLLHLYLQLNARKSCVLYSSPCCLI